MVAGYEYRGRYLAGNLFDHIAGHVQSIIIHNFSLKIGHFTLGDLIYAH